MPDAELRELAAQGRLHNPEVLADQARRMLHDERARALATEFACQWLDIREFDQHNEKSEQVFPEFAALRGAMYEESVRFFVDLFQRDGSVLDILDANYTFLSEPLARFYGIPGVNGPQWRRVDQVKSQGRGGVLGMAALLAKQSGASRTSPILRGNWLLESLLGDKLPKPPPNVPLLPESELGTGGLTMRQITEKHRSQASCAKCHERMDPFGFALERFDAIGRRRQTDLAGRAIDTQVQLKDGTRFDDIGGLRDYLLSKRRDEFLRQFCRKLLGFALGRSVQLSDSALLDEMRQTMTDRGHGRSAAIITIIQSPQFRQRRGLASPLEQLTDHQAGAREEYTMTTLSDRASREVLSRRTMLRGLGVTMALPWLESLRVWGDEPTGRVAASQPPIRFACLFSGNGFHSKEWWARGTGRDMKLGKVLEPLDPFKEKLLFIRGLFNAEALKGNIHSSQTGNLLSGAPWPRAARSGRERASTRCSPRRSAARPRCPASCWRASRRWRRFTRITRCSTALISRGPRRPRRLRSSSIPRLPSTACSRTTSTRPTRACSTPCSTTPARCAGGSATPISSSSTSI